MSSFKLLKTTKVSGTIENVVINGNVISGDENGLKVQVTEDVKSELKDKDWRSGEIVYFPTSQLDVTPEQLLDLIKSVIS